MTDRPVCGEVYHAENIMHFEDISPVMNYFRALFFEYGLGLNCPGRVDFLDGCAYGFVCFYHHNTRIEKSHSR